MIVANRTAIDYADLTRALGQVFHCCCQLWQQTATCILIGNRVLFPIKLVYLYNVLDKYLVSTLMSRSLILKIQNGTDVPQTQLT